MKKLDVQIVVDDVVAAINLAKNNKLNKTSYPHLKNNLDLIIKQYIHYEENAGNAVDIIKEIVPDGLKNGLKSNYEHPPKGLKFIKELRESSPDICPMCGSFHSSTLDHLLPKEDYPEWTVYSKNLVPACQCNSKRGRTLLGDLVAKERILHPYYDDILNDRNVSCTINSDDDYRLVAIDLICIAPNDSNYNAIRFHIEKIVKKAGIIRWLESQWVKLRRDPSCVISNLDEDKLLDDIEDLTNLLEKLLSRLDRRNGTPNNWKSIFIHGILNSQDVIDWIFQHHNGIVLGDIDKVDCC